VLRFQVEYGFSFVVLMPSTAEVSARRELLFNQELHQNAEQGLSAAPILYFAIRSQRSISRDLNE